MLSPQKREELALELLNSDTEIGIGWAWPEEIDRINIHHASLLAMRRALSSIVPLPDYIFVDGRFVPNTCVSSEAVVKGDSTVPEIMAASIIAKVARDRWMIRYSWIEREFGFEKHKGYPTKEHRKICNERGLSAIHRRSFSLSIRDLNLPSLDRDHSRGDHHVS